MLSDRFYERLSHIAGLLALLAILLLTIFAANIEIKDLDIWLHIGMGRTIVQNLSVPDHDILSCTIAGQPWNNHEWLFQVIVYWIFSRWGADGLLTMQVILVTLTMCILLFLGYNPKKQLPMILFFLFVALTYQSRFTTRPDLFSLFFFALYILILAFYLESRWSIPFLFLVQTLWVNIHGFFFFGPLFVLIGLGAEWIKRHVPLPYQWNKVGRLNNREYRHLKIILAAVVAACFLNPQGWKGAVYPLIVFFNISGEHRIFFEKIVELKPPITWDTLFSPDVYPFYKLTIFISCISFVFNRRRLDIGTLIFWLIFLIFSLSAVRNMIYFAFAAYLAFVTNILSLNLRDVVPLRITDKKFLSIFSLGVKVLILMWIAQYASAISLNGYYDFDKYERKSEFGGIAQRNFPIKAVDFLVDNNVKGNFFNDFNSGAYLVGRCYPNIRVFIDGRTEVYGVEFFKYYQKVWEKQDKEEFRRMLDKYKITGVFLNSVYRPLPEHALDVLYKDPKWILVYLDHDGVIFLKDIPENQSVIQEYAVDFDTWRPPTFDLLKMGAVKATPYQQVNRAYTLESLGQDDLAEEEMRMALWISPQVLEPYKLLGKIHAKRKDFETAFRYFRIATLFAPHDKMVRHNLALTYYDMGEYEYAEREYGKILNRWPNEPKALFRLARTQLKAGKLKEALVSLKKAWEAAPDHAQDVVRFAEILEEEGHRDEAFTVLEDVLKEEKPPVQAFQVTARFLKEDQRLEEAEAILKRGHELIPDEKEWEDPEGSSVESSDQYKDSLL